MFCKKDRVPWPIIWWKRGSCKLASHYCHCHWQQQKGNTWSDLEVVKGTRPTGCFVRTKPSVRFLKRRCNHFSIAVLNAESLCNPKEVTEGFQVECFSQTANEFLELEPTFGGQGFCGITNKFIKTLFFKRKFVSVNYMLSPEWWPRMFIFK